MVSGAGFVVFKKFQNEIKFLGLIGPKFHQERCKGIYDITKGSIDPGESALAAAIREAKEEASYNIELKDIISGPFVDGMLTMWLAEVYTDPVLGINPYNGLIEHTGFKWLTASELKNSCYNYLYPSINWACNQAKKLL